MLKCKEAVIAWKETKYVNHSGHKHVEWVRKEKRKAIPVKSRGGL
jgi:hypothetical protein